MLNSTALAALRRLPNLPEAERIKLLCSKTYDSLAVARCRARMSQHLFCMNPPSEQIYLPCSDPFSPEALQEAKRHFGTGPAIPASRPVARQTHQKYTVFFLIIINDPLSGMVFNFPISMFNLEQILKFQRIKTSGFGRKVGRRYIFGTSMNSPVVAAQNFSFSFP